MTNQSTEEATRIGFLLEPEDAIALVGLVQLALRHPAMPPLCAQVGREVVEVVRGLLPSYAPLIDAGWVE